MNIKEIINKKRLNKELTKEEISYAVNGFVDGSVADYQMSALLMAITINGMTFLETLNLTDCMLKSGEILDLSKIDGVVVDKHSTGGIGDKVTIILAPLLASLGIKVAKMSGRGLGYTGGTIDKLEGIDGFNVSLDEDKFINQVNNINIAITQATANLDIADKKIYALRDVTATVDSIALIASSIMSKKLASNADLIVIDVKVGKGALMKTKKDAIKLAHYLIDIGKHYNKKVICLLTNMNQPLGYCVGNKLEIKESIEALKGKGAQDLMEVVYSIASIIISNVKNISIKQAYKLALTNIENNKAYTTFKKFVHEQNGTLDKFKIDANYVDIVSDKSGFVKEIDALEIGKISLNLGAGRLNKDDFIDYNVGIKLFKKVNDRVEKGDVLGRIYYNSETFNFNDLKKCFKFSDKKVNCETIYGKIDT